MTGTDHLDLDGYIDAALAAIGGDDTEFFLNGCGGPAGVEHAVRLTCRYQGCEWGIFVGEMELWEFITDARQHWESMHAPTSPVAAH
jgi:hypothetical protein